AKSPPGAASQESAFLGDLPFSQGGTIGSVGSPTQSALTDWQPSPSLEVETRSAGALRSSVPGGNAHASGAGSSRPSSPRRSSSLSAGPAHAPSQPRSTPSQVPAEH